MQALEEALISPLLNSHDIRAVSYTQLDVYKRQAIVLHKELLIPILCGIFLMENLSVVMQVSYFKYTKKRFGDK